MSGKGSISRMSDECLMKQETVFPVLYCVSGCYAEVHISWEIRQKSVIKKRKPVHV